MTLARSFGIRSGALLFVGLVVSGQACSDDAGGGGSGAGSTTSSSTSTGPASNWRNWVDGPTAAFFDAYIALYCEKATPCCMEERRAHDPATCVEVMNSGFHIPIVRYEEGGPSVDPARAAQCLLAMETWFDVCRYGLPPECVDPFGEGSPPGAECAHPLDCAGDGAQADCKWDPSEGRRCVREYFVGAGEPCAPLGMSDLIDTYEAPVCDFGLACTPAGCIELLPEGSPCECYPYEPCCDYDTSCRASVCQTRSALGEACGSNLPDCGVDAFCDEGLCVQKGKVGDPCSEPGGNQCYSGCDGANCFDISNLRDGLICIG